MARNFKKPGNFMQNGPKNLVFTVLFLVITLAFLSRLTDMTRQVSRLKYSEFKEKVTSGEVKSVHFSGQDVTGKLNDGQRFETVVLEGDTKLPELLQDNNVTIDVESAATGFSPWNFMLFGLFIFAIALIVYFFRHARGGSGGGAGGIFSMGKSKAKMFMPSTIREKFHSVAGADGAKEELQDVVDFLRNPAKYERLGAKIPKGVLLVGDPGNGKTLLARAVAGEANCPFFSASGSDFIEVFVGIGAARVRDLFEQARKKAPAIIFIDEIDAVGRQRGAGGMSGHDEREQTLNQLLTEMDGFDNTKEPVIVIAATNREDVLDKALLRPGRFDRTVNVPYPDLKSREEILRIHSKGVRLADEMDMKKFARGTPGFTGADLANLVNEAAINASKHNRSDVTAEDFEEARDKMMLGKKWKAGVVSDKDQKLTAYHEAGHALIRLLKPEICEPLHKVTIGPRGSALGVAYSLPARDRFSQSKSEIIGEVLSALGGRGAEEVAFGESYTGASSDFQKATEMVRNMVRHYGMSDSLGTIVYSQNDNYVFSQETAREIDNEVKRIMAECNKEVRDLLTANRDKLDALANALLERETLQAEEIYELLGIEPRETHSWRAKSSDNSDTPSDEGGSPEEGLDIVSDVVPEA